MCKSASCETCRKCTHPSRSHDRFLGSFLVLESALHTAEYERALGFKLTCIIACREGYLVGLYVRPFLPPSQSPADAHCNGAPSVKSSLILFPFSSLASFPFSSQGSPCSFVQEHVAAVDLRCRQCANTIPVLSRWEPRARRHGQRPQRGVVHVRPQGHQGGEGIPANGESQLTIRVQVLVRREKVGSEGVLLTGVVRKGGDCSGVVA